VTTLT
jgi:hypothetical protein